MSEVDDYILDIDSSERDINTFTNINNFEVELKNEIYDLSKLSIISGNFHTPQLTLSDTNNTLIVRDIPISTNVTINLDTKNYTDGNVLASDLQTQLSNVNSNITSVSYSSETSRLTFSGTQAFAFYMNNDNSPYNVLGFSKQYVSSSGNQLVSGAINLNGPNTLILKISSGSEILSKDIFCADPFFTGRIQLKDRDKTHYIGRDDPIEHSFKSGSLKHIKKLRFEMFYLHGEKLVPYDFRNMNYSLKLLIKCSKDKLKNKPKVNRDISLPPPINIPEFEDVDRWKKYKIYIAMFVIILTGLILLFMIKPT